MSTYIANIGAYTDLLYNHIETLGIPFPVYNGKPLRELAGEYVYFRLENNETHTATDHGTGVLIKKASFDFIFVGGHNTPDARLYAMLDTLSNAFCTKNIRIGSAFKIISIFEGQQSGVIRDTKQNPLLLWTYNIIYHARYEKDPR